MRTFLFLLLWSSGFISVPPSPIITMKEDQQQSDAFDQQGHKYFQILQLRQTLQQQLTQQPNLAQQDTLKKLLAQCDDMARQLLRYAKMKNTSLKALQARVEQRLSVPSSSSNRRPINVNPTTPAPQGKEDIEINDFVAACLQWRQAMYVFLRETGKQYAAVKIELARFKTDLQMNQSPLPIVQSLYTEWTGVVDALSSKGDTTTGAALFEALRDHSGNAWQLTKDQEGLKKHYKKHRADYRRTSGEVMSFQQGQLPKQQVLLDALQASISKEDPNLPENQAKTEEKDEKIFERMRQKWDNWLNRDLVPALEEPDTATEGKLIDLNLLQQNQTVYLMAPTYAQDFWNTTSTVILSKAKALGGTPSYDQVALIAVKTVKEQYNVYVMNEAFIQAAVESNKGDLPSGLKLWIVNSIEQDDQLYDQLVATCSEWALEVQDITGQAQKANRNKAFRVARDQWVAQLKASFTGPTQPLVQPLVDQLPKDKTLDLKQIQQAWQQGLTAIQDPNFLEPLWMEQFTRNPEQAAIESVLTAFKTHLPQLQQLAQQLIDAQPQSTQKPLVQYAQTDTVQTRLAIVWNEVPVLIGAGLQELSEETGLESLAEGLARQLSGNWTVDTSSGLQDMVLRATAPMNLDLKIPLKLQQQGPTVLALPTALDNSMVKFVGGDDGHYAVTVQRIAINTQPRTQGNNTTQEILVTLEIENPQWSVSISGSAVFAGVETAVTKNPVKTSIDLVFSLTQDHQPNNNQIQAQFAQVRLVEESALIQTVELMERPIQTLQVYR